MVHGSGMISVLVEVVLLDSQIYFTLSSRRTGDF